MKLTPDTFRNEGVATCLRKGNGFVAGNMFQHECGRTGQQAHDFVSIGMHLPHWPVGFKCMAGNQVFVVKRSEFTGYETGPERVVDREGFRRRIATQPNVSRG